MELHIKPFKDDDEKLVHQYQTNHSKFHNGDSGFDLFVLADIEVPSKSTVALHFGISCQAFRNSTGKLCSYYLYPRSSISKTPLRMSNSVGLIDSSYRGEIMAKVDNNSDKEYIIKSGTRLFQLAAPDLGGNIKYRFVEELSKTDRGSGGFGSTGK